MSRTSPVSGLPHNWEYDEKTDCVICGGCCFRFGAEHPEGNGSGWLCPNCGDGNGKPELSEDTKSDLAPTADLQEAIADRLVDWTYLHATEGVQWPSTKTKSMLIARAMQGGPTQDHADGMKAVASPDTSTGGNSK